MVAFLFTIKMEENHDLSYNYMRFVALGYDKVRSDKMITNNYNYSVKINRVNRKRFFDSPTIFYD